MHTRAYHTCSSLPRLAFEAKAGLIKTGQVIRVSDNLMQPLQHKAITRAARVRFDCSAKYAN